MAKSGHANFDDRKMNIPLGIEGQVLNGTNPGMKVRVEEDPQSTSGYLIYRWWEGSGGLGPNAAFEDRVESRKLLEEYFAQAGWKLDWRGGTWRRSR
jgi:hypothetical protein